MRPPGAPDIPGMGGPLGGGGLPGVGGGGMHVGPNDPLFAGHMGIGRGRMGAGGLPPGARWDPIGPPGMQACSRSRTLGVCCACKSALKQRHMSLIYIKMSSAYCFLPLGFGKVFSQLLLACVTWSPHAIMPGGGGASLYQ